MQIRKGQDAADAEEVPGSLRSPHPCAEAALNSTRGGWQDSHENYFHIWQQDVHQRRHEVVVMVVMENGPA